VYEPWLEKIKVKKWEPPEAEAELQKTLAEIDQVNRYIKLIEDEPVDLIAICNKGDWDGVRDYIRRWVEADVPFSEVGLLRGFFWAFNPNFYYHMVTDQPTGGYSALRGMREVFPSEQVKRTLRPVPIPGEKFFVIEDPASLSAVEQAVEEAVKRTRPLDTSSYPKEGFTSLSNFLLPSNQPSLNLSALEQAVQLYHQKNYPLYVQRSIQALLQPYWQNAIYHFVPALGEYFIRQKAERRIREERQRNSSREGLIYCMQVLGVILLV
jgi:hypothetical protein